MVRAEGKGSERPHKPEFGDRKPRVVELAGAICRVNSANKGSNLAADLT